MIINAKDHTYITSQVQPKGQWEEGRQGGGQGGLNSKHQTVDNISSRSKWRLCTFFSPASSSSFFFFFFTSSLFFSLIFFIAGFLFVCVCVCVVNIEFCKWFRQRLTLVAAPGCGRHLLSRNQKMKRKKAQEYATTIIMERKRKRFLFSF